MERILKIALTIEKKLRGDETTIELGSDAHTYCLEIFKKIQNVKNFNGHINLYKKLQKYKLETNMKVNLVVLTIFIEIFNPVPTGIIISKQDIQHSIDSNKDLTMFFKFLRRLKKFPKSPMGTEPLGLRTPTQTGRTTVKTSVYDLKYAYAYVDPVNKIDFFDLKL